MLMDPPNKYLKVHTQTHTIQKKNIHTNNKKTKKIGSEKDTFEK